MGLTSANILSIASTGISFPSFFTYTNPYVAAASTSCLATSASGRDPEMLMMGMCPDWPFVVAIAYGGG